MGRLAKRIADRRRAAADPPLPGSRHHGARGGDSERHEGTPQGGPLSPLLANVLLDEVDRELERRGHAFVRYADDCNVYVQSRRAGERVMRGCCAAAMRSCALKVNESKSAVGSGLGTQVPGLLPVRSPRRARSSERWPIRPCDKMKERVRQHHAAHAGAEHRTDRRRAAGLLPGWKAYFRLAQTPRSCASWTSGCGTGCEPCSSSSGGAGRRCSASCARWGLSVDLAARIAGNAGAGGATPPWA